MSAVAHRWGRPRALSCVMTLPSGRLPSRVHHLSGVGEVARPQPADPSPGRIAAMLRTVEARLPLQRRVVRAGATVCLAGERFEHLHVVHCGALKIVNAGPDGREQLVALQFRGDWLGLDGIASGQHTCDTVALDTGELWSVRYDTLLRIGCEHPALLALLHEQMSREIARGRDAMLSMCTLSVAARVATFLRQWVESLSGPGMGEGQVHLRMSRAEIGSHLGMRLESVSRAMTFLVRSGMIGFAEKGRRIVTIRDGPALNAFIRDSAQNGRSGRA